MKNLLIVSLVLFSSYCYSQSITLKVLGQHAYSNNSEAYGAIISLEENPNKCDPVLGFVKIEEQFKHLSEAIKSIGSNSVLIPIKEYTYSEFRNKSYKLEEANQDLFDEILSICNSQLVKVVKTYYKIPPHEFIEEDVKAIAALKDAESKAEVIANHLDYKVNKILNIDDDTREASELYELANGDPERMKFFLEIIEKLGGTNVNYNESKKPNIKGKYSLWVTFELVQI